MRGSAGHLLTRRLLLYFYLGKWKLRSREVPFSKAPPATPPCITVGLYEGGAVNRSSRSRKSGGWCEMKAIWEDDGGAPWDTLSVRCHKNI